MTSANIERHYWVEGDDGANYGVVPATVSQRYAMRATTDALALSPNYQRSTRVGTPRRRQGNVRIDESAAGAINDEFSPIDPDAFLLAGLAASAWSSAVSIVSEAVGISAPSSGLQTITADAGTPFSGLTPGNWLRVTGAAIAGNNCIAKISSVGGGGASVVIANANGAVDASDTISVQQLSQAVDGQVVRSFGVMRDYTHLTNRFAIFPGVIINGFRISAANGQKVTISFDAQAKDELSPSSLPTFTASDAAPDSEAFTPNDVYAVLVDGTSFCITSFELSVANNARGKRCLGTRGDTLKRFGFADVGGSFNYEYDDDSADFFDQFIADTTSSIAFVIANADGGYVFELEKMRQLNGNRAGGEGDADILVTAQFEAEEGTNFVLKIAKFAGAIS